MCYIRGKLLLALISALYNPKRELPGCRPGSFLRGNGECCEFELIHCIAKPKAGKREDNVVRKFYANQKTAWKPVYRRYPSNSLVHHESPVLQFALFSSPRSGLRFEWWTIGGQLQ